MIRHCELQTSRANMHCINNNSVQFTLQIMFASYLAILFPVSQSQDMKNSM